MLLDDLHRPTANPSAVQPVLARAVANSLPTSLVATAVAAPLFLQHPFTLPRLNPFAAAFRQAVHLRRKSSNDDWVNAILNGLQGGHPVLRLAAAGGLILGFADKSLPIPSRAQDHVVIALAQVMAMYTSVDWDTHNSHDALSLSLVLASQSLPLIAPERLKALPLPTLVNLLTASLVFAFTENDLTSVSSLSKLTALCLSLLLDSRPTDGLPTAHACLISFRDLAAANPSKPLLFSTVMISSAVLSSAVYISPATYSHPDSTTPASLAHTTLHALSHMSSLIADFGGISSTSTDSFTELRKTTYLALDILAVGTSGVTDSDADTFIHELLSNQNLSEEHYLAFTLACIEQLVPVLSVSCIVDRVWPTVEQHLSDSTHRQVYESAHSVVLTVFAKASASIAKGEVYIDNGSGKGKDTQTHSLTSFTSTIIPFYTRSLVHENSLSDEKLNTVQLGMAFEACVRCAVAIDSEHHNGTRRDYPLAAFAVNEVSKAMKELEARPQQDQDQQGQLHRLRLALIFSMSALPISLLKEVLEEMKRVVVGLNEDLENEKNKKEKEEIVQALYKEILERVGDREKELVVRWWYENLEVLGSESSSVKNENTNEGRGAGWGEWLRARL